MKIALLVLLGLILGALGGAALGVGAGLVWVEISKTPNFEGHSGMLVFFTFMPAGCHSGRPHWRRHLRLAGLGGTAKSLSSRRQNLRGTRNIQNTKAFVQCKNADWFFETIDLFQRPTVE
jgi:hypothetical protein